MRTYRDYAFARTVTITIKNTRRGLEVKRTIIEGPVTVSQSVVSVHCDAKLCGRQFNAWVQEELVRSTPLPTGHPRYQVDAMIDRERERSAEALRGNKVSSGSIEWDGWDKV